MGRSRDEDYLKYVRDPLILQASPWVWSVFDKGECDLNWYELDSFELLHKGELIGIMEGGNWNER